jgi:hypothetical protein
MNNVVAVEIPEGVPGDAARSALLESCRAMTSPRPSSSSTRAHSRAAYSMLVASVWWLSRRGPQ